jgi:hypothetical protein
MTGEFEDLDALIQLTKSYLSGKPQATGEDILVNLLKTRDLASDTTQAGQDECRFCDRPIVLDGDCWVHLMPDKVGMSQQGCHAASWDWAEGADKGWDQSLAPYLVATPKSR